MFKGFLSLIPVLVGITARLCGSDFYGDCEIDAIYVSKMDRFPSYLSAI